MLYEVITAFIAEYGGGLGSLARHIADTAPTAKVLVVEPYPTRLALRLAQQYPNLTYEATLPEGADVVIAQDVLEHVTDPLADFALV